MSLKQRITDDLKAALKSRDALRLGVLRMLKAGILEAEVEQRGKQGLEYQADDAEVTRVLAAYAKQRRESIESYRQGGREDLAEQEQRELTVVEAYLPRPLSEAELREAVRQAIAETGAATSRDVGKVMKAVMPKLRGAADGKLVNRIALELLGG
ncbi:MAG: GatB/YqeY domain-containing protein [Acidobacteria bacterium]|nr:GatB/YqeY domain-containing protein [Acidobacteriota bacterium]